MNTLKEIIIVQKCRKGAATGTTKRGAYWLAVAPIKIRRAGGDGIGQNPCDITYYLELRHFRDGEVKAVVNEHRWHQNGSWSGARDSYTDAGSVLTCTTIEEVVIALKGVSIDDSPVYGNGSQVETILATLGMPVSAPAPDEIVTS